MTELWVVGSGASGVHFALTALQKGHSVTMVDVGHVGRRAPHPDTTLSELKERLDDPAEYFLGARFDNVTLPGPQSEYYGFPPGKDFVFQKRPDFDVQSRGFRPLFSFAQGGLAEVWTGGCYPLSDSDFEKFPFSYDDLEPFYSRVAHRIGVTGAEDDLSRFYPVHSGLLPPLELDEHSRVLLDAYESSKGSLNRRGCYMGRSRVATLSRDLDQRRGCDYLGRCLWGCPIDSLYTPSQTLKQCLDHPEFTYLSGLEVRCFRVDRRSRVRSLVVRPIDGGALQELAVDCLILAAGTLETSRIFLESVYRDSGEKIRLEGLMDNRQILVPFVKLNMIGRQFSEKNYQYHQIGLGIDGGEASSYVHGQVTTLKTALLHPFVQQLPFDMKTALNLTRSLHAALGLVNVNLHDWRRTENQLSLILNKEASQAHDVPSLSVRYRPPDGEGTRIRKVLGSLKSALLRLGCVVPPGMAHVRPMGASVHYAGTLPMSRESQSWCTNEICQSWDFENLFVVDGSTFPFLPAKNLTFTLMANATRIAEQAF